MKEKLFFLFISILLMNPVLFGGSSFTYAQKIGINDEGIHEKNIFNTQEWWYFNGVLNADSCELKNWSFMISFNIQKNCDIFFFTLYDDMNKSYGGSIAKNHGSIRSNNAPGMSICFNNSSFAVGKYPSWFVHAESDSLCDQNIVCDLLFNTTSDPHWLFFNTGKNKSMSPFGHYSLLNCSISGKIIIDDVTFSVEGVGYHEHHWFSFLPDFSCIKENNDFENKLDAWYWYCLYLDNGYSFFIGDLFANSRFGSFLPNLMFLTKDGKNFSECYFFHITYLEMKNTSLPSIKIPSRTRVNGFFLNNVFNSNRKDVLFFDLVIENKNIKENIWGLSNAGLWEGSCLVKGSFYSLFHHESWSGQGIVEISYNN